MRAVLAAVVAGFALSACVMSTSGGNSAPQRHLQWPPEPLAARIVWVKEIRDYRDGGITVGFWKRVAELLHGETDKRLGRPYGIYVDDSDRLFIVDSGLMMVHMLDLKQKRYTVIGDGKTAYFRSPIGITGDGNDTVYITDSESSVIFRYSVKENKLTPFITSLERPTGIAFNRTNHLLYITDTAAHNVVVFDQRGRERLRIGGRGEGNGRFNFPTDLTVDPKGTLYVTDSLNGRIQRFSPEGKFLVQIGRAGDVVGTFSKPKGVATDSEGHVYVSDALFDTVQIFDDTGRILLNFGENGTDIGQFWMPSGMYIDRNDYIYVADSYNRRVQVFRYLKVDEHGKQEQVPR